MKKSEKIEIRVSFDEKEQLARLAESEGQSVSELVRGLARKYAQLNMPRPRPKLSRLHMLGLVLCGLGLGAGASFSILNGNTHKISTKYTVHGVIQNTGFSFQLDDDIGTEFLVDLDKVGSEYRVKAIVKPGAVRPIAEFKICKITGDSCLTNAAAQLVMERNSDGSVWQTETKAGDNLFLVMQPVFVG